jgi:hypothetical protein
MESMGHSPVSCMLVIKVHHYFETIFSQQIEYISRYVCL